MEGRILILNSTSIAKYMAVSETIQESVGKGYPVTVVLSPGWKRKGISVGKKQRIEYVDLKSCKEDGIEVVRRHTEGYAALHYTDDVTYGIAIPREYVRSKRDFDDGILPILVRSLERINVPNGYDPFHERYGNIFVNGRKISGSAQNTNNRNAWLQHGIIALRRHDAKDYVRYINGGKDSIKIESQMTSVEEEGGIAIADNFVAVMAEEFRSHLLELGVDLGPSSLSAEELEYTEELLKTKYESGEWLLFGTGKQDESGRIGCFTGWKKV